MAIPMPLTEEQKLSKFPVAIIVIRNLPGYDQNVVHKEWRFTQEVRKAWLVKYPQVVEADVQSVVHEITQTCKRDVELFIRQFVEFSRATWSYLPIFEEDIEEI